MRSNTKAKLLRIFISSTDKLKHKPLYEVIIFAAKRFDIAGATVIKGVMGYGASSQIFSQKLWEVSEKIPIIIEIIDEDEKIEQFLNVILPYFEKVKKGYMITLEDSSILVRRKGEKG